MGTVFEKYQWNYKVITEKIPADEEEARVLEKRLNDLGSSYWEVVAIQPRPGFTHLLIFLKCSKWRTVVSSDLPL